MADRELNLKKLSTNFQQNTKHQNIERELILEHY